jgi:hypothetical protein
MFELLISLLRSSVHDSSIFFMLWFETMSLGQNHCFYILCRSYGILNNYKTQRSGNWEYFRLQVRERRHLLSLYESGRCYSYIGEKSIPLEVCIKGYKYSLTQGLFKKSRLTEYAYEEDHEICWKEAMVL